MGKETSLRGIGLADIFRQVSDLSPTSSLLSQFDAKFYKKQEVLAPKQIIMRRLLKIETMAGRSELGPYPKTHLIEGAYPKT